MRQEPCGVFDQAPRRAATNGDGGVAAATGAGAGATVVVVVGATVVVVVATEVLVDDVVDVPGDALDAGSAQPLRASRDATRPAATGREITEEEYGGRNGPKGVSPSRSS